MPDKRFYNQLNSTITTFLWDKKSEGTPSKVMYDQITRTLEDGGLQLTNLYFTEIALKTNWVKKSLDSECFWVAHAQNVLPWSVPQIWRCNIDSKDITNFFKQKKKTTIWCDIWCTWRKFVFH